MTTDKTPPEKKSFWQMAIMPHPSLEDDVNERHLATVLSIFLISFLPLYFLPEGIRAIIEKHPPIEITYFWVSVFALSVAYLLARSPYPRGGAHLIILYFTLIPFATLVVYSDRYAGANAKDALIWSVPIMLMALILLPPNQVRWVILFNISLYIFLPILWTKLSYQQVFSTLWLVVAVGGLMMVSAFVQNIYIKRAEQEAEQSRISEVRYREIFLGSPVALWEADLSQIKRHLDALTAEHGSDLMAYIGNHPEAMVGAASSVILLDANQAALELYETDDVAALKESLHIVASANEMLALRDGVIDLWRGGRNNPIETVHQTLKGNIKNVVARLAVGLGYADTWERVIISIEDVTEQRTAEASMRQLASAIEASASSVVITGLDGKIEYVNPAFSQNTGYTKEEAMGENPRVLKSGQHPPEFYQKMWGALLKGETWQGEIINKKKNGELYYERAAISPVKDDTGEVVSYVAVKDDITKIKEAERDLRSLSSATEQSASGVVITDVEGYVEYINPAFTLMSGYTQKEILGKTLDKTQNSGEHGEDFYKELTETIARGEIWKGEIINRRKDGSLYWESMIHSPVKNDDGKIIQYVEVKEDITRRKEIEQALALAHEDVLVASDMKTQLLANVSHDMRTPLGAILGYTEMLQTGVFQPLNDQQLEATRAIASSSQKLLDFVSNLLNQAQIDTGKIILNQSLFRPQQLLDTLGGEFSLARTQGLTVETQIDENLPEKICGDSYWLGQILHNLLSNAIKFTPREGKIVIHLLRSGEKTWALEVADNGRGIPPEAQNYIFESFRQVDGSPSRKEHTGSGLGLSIVNHLVRLMDGEIKVESEVGKGSVFTIFLPLREDEEKIA